MSDHAGTAEGIARGGHSNCRATKQYEAAMTHVRSIHLNSLEHVLCQVPGVHAVHITPSAEGTIDAIHIVGTRRRSAQHIISDVELAVFVHAQLRLDRSRITLMQPTKADISMPEVRVQLREVVHAAREPIVTVTLVLHERRLLGIGRSRPGHTDSVEQRAAEATIHALNRLLEPRGQVWLENIQRAQIGLFEVCLVQLALTGGDETQPALGVSMISGDIAEAAARAVLDAVNRRLSRLLGRAS
jgi:hypothetical protein